MDKLVKSIIRDCEYGDCYDTHALKSYIESYCEDEEIEKDTKEWNDLVVYVWRKMSELKYEHFENITNFFIYLEGE